jgi:hypothetical protein
MTTYYVGPGGNDGSAGTSWATRKLTLNGAEDIPVTAGDTVYVGPGVYRETLTVDVNGTSGNVITYIGDVTGEHTDGIGGVVRVTGSDDDQTSTRAMCIDSNNKDYRTFRGFRFDGTSAYEVRIDHDSTHITIEDCFVEGEAYNDYGIYVTGGAASNVTIRRCVLISAGYSIYVLSGAGLTATSCVIENCLMMSGTYGVYWAGTGGWVARNCTIAGMLGAGFRANGLGGESNTVNNCSIFGCYNGIVASAVGEIVEDYNNFSGCLGNRSNTNVGAHSQAYMTLPLSPVLLSGYKIPWWFGELSEWSALRAITGASERTEDLRGQLRPTTAAKNSWGALQFHDVEHESTTLHDGAASIKLSDAGLVQMWIPHSGEQITVSVYAYREADYAGTLPRMVIKQPGQSDRTTTDTGSASAWNLLSDTFTPASDPEYVVAELQSLNTAAAGSYAAYFDDLQVS